MPECNICHQAMFVRTDLLLRSKFDTKYHVYADWAKWRQLMVEGCSFKHVPVVVCSFDAIGGLSSVLTWRNILDFIRLQSAFPSGMALQALALKKMIDRVKEKSRQLEAERDHVLAELAVAHAEAPGWKASYEGMSNSTC